MQAKRLILIAFLVGICFATAYSQQNSGIVIGKDGSPRCDFVQGALEAFARQLDADDRVFVLSYLGEGEKRQLSKRRLEAIVSFWKSRTSLKWIPEPKSLIPALATVKKTDGTVEIYANGELGFTLIYRRNMNTQYATCPND